MMRSESTSAFGQPSETKPTFGGLILVRRLRAGAGVAAREVRGLDRVAVIGMGGFYRRLGRQATGERVLGRSAAEDLACDAEGVGVRLHRICDRVRIAAADRD